MMNLFGSKGENDADADIRRVRGKGIDVKLEKYTRLMVTSRGIDYWYPEYQEFLLNKLSPFLPRMEFDPEKNSVTATMVTEGKEVLGNSRRIKNTADIPPDAHRELVRKIEELRQEVQKQGADPDRRRLIENFSLPDPYFSPELYRVYGKNKLAILWGLEKRDAGTPIMILDWPDKFPSPPPTPSGPIWVEYLLRALKYLLFALLFLALGFGGTWLLDKYGEPVSAYIKKLLDGPPISVEQVKKSAYEVQAVKNGNIIETSPAIAVKPDGTMITSARAMKDYGTPGVSYRVKSPDGSTYPVDDDNIHIKEGGELAMFKADVDRKIPCLNLRDNRKPGLDENVYSCDIQGKDPDIKSVAISSVDADQQPDNFTQFSLGADLPATCPILDGDTQVVGVVVPDAGMEIPKHSTAVWIDDLGKLTVPESSDVKEAHDAAKNAVEAAKESDTERAWQEAERSQTAADRAVLNPRYHDIAQRYADWSRRVAAYVDPIKAMEDINIAREKLKELSTGSEEARRLVRDAKINAEGLALRAENTQLPEDVKRAKDARWIADEISYGVDVGDAFDVIANGIRFRIDPIPGQPNCVFVQVVAEDVVQEGSSINGVPLDADNRVRIQVQGDSEEVPYSLILRDRSYPQTGSVRLRRK